MPEYKPQKLKPLGESGSKTTYTIKSTSKEELVGGKADNRPDSDFDAEQLKIGTKVEFEHTHDRKKAKEIAKDHLTESPDYYRELKVMENKLEETKKSLKRALDLVKSIKESLTQEEMDLKKKFKSKDQQKYMYAAAERGDIPKKVVEEFSDKTKNFKKLPEKVKKGHDGLSPYTQGEPVREGEKSTDTPDDTHVFVTKKNSDPGSWAGSSFEDQEALPYLYEAVAKALKAAAILGLSRRQRMNAAYQLGVAEGRQAENETPFATEDLSETPIQIGITRDQLRPPYEPPVVPIRRVETPGYIPPKPCGDHEYKVKEAGPAEAKPIKDR